MNGIIKTLESKEGFVHAQSASDGEIEKAEKKLGLSFSSDYKEYLKKFGCGSGGGFELTGIISSPRLNVVDVTLNARKENKSFPDDVYVVENTGYDDMMTVQNAEGKVFLIAPDGSKKEIVGGLAAYLEKA